jgi:hypothetical protein
MPDETLVNPPQNTPAPTSHLTQPARELVQIFATPDEDATESVTGSIKVSTAATLPALFYEKIRNIIEYHEDHLLRRAAIERILERLVRSKHATRQIAETLIRELLWARYLKNESVPLSKIDEVDKIIQKYQKFPAVSHEQIEWVRSIESYDIERVLVETFKKEAMVSFMYRIFSPQIKLDETYSEEEKNIQIYIASHKALAHSDEAILRYFLLHLLFPDLKESVPQEIIDNFSKIYEKIESQIKNQANIILTRHLRKNVAPFLILEDTLRKNSRIETYENQESLEKEVTEIANTRYHELKSKITRMATRSIIYVFISKMLIAFLFEIPSDLWITKDFRILSLLINISFPPAMMFALTLTVKAPGKDNTEKVVKRIKTMLYQTEEAKRLNPIFISLKPRQYGPILAIFLTAIYILAFIVSFGVILKTLAFLKFSLLSKVVFVLFLSGVAFFAYQIRQVAKDYKVSDREGFLSPVADFFMVPILSLGQWVGKGLARFNFLTFIFDFIIEAPLKTIIEVFEELTHFLREKREEVV